MKEQKSNKIIEVTNAKAIQEIIKIQLVSSKVTKFIDFLDSRRK